MRCLCSSIRRFCAFSTVKVGLLDNSKLNELTHDKGTYGLIVYITAMHTSVQLKWITVLHALEENAWQPVCPPAECSASESLRDIASIAGTAHMPFHLEERSMSWLSSRPFI